MLIYRNVEISGCRGCVRPEHEHWPQEYDRSHERVRRRYRQTDGRGRKRKMQFGPVRKFWIAA